MAVEVIPAVLARSVGSWKTILTKTVALTPRVHIDIMDGSLTSGRSIGPTVLAAASLGRAAEVHLMVRHPERWLTAVKASGARRVILHVEIGERLVPVAAAFRSFGIAVSVALMHRTPVSALTPVARWADGVHLMTGPAGAYGGRFQRSSLQRIKDIHRRWPRKNITCDVGMTPETVPLARRAGAARFVVGSYLQQHPNPLIAFRQLQRVSK